MSASFNEELVDVVKGYPVLYAKSESRKLAERDRAWITVAKRLNRREAECKTRWKSIRDNYYKMVKKRNMGLTCDFFSYLDLGFLDENPDIEHSENNTKESEIVIPEDSQGYTVTVKNEDQYNKYVHRHSTSISEPAVSEKDYDMDPLVSVRLEEDTKHGIRVITQAKTLDLPPPLIKIVKPPREEKPVEVRDRITKMSRQNMLLKKRLQQLKKLQNANRTPTHSFFRAMADVVCKFPPEKIANVRMRICTIVTSEELNCIQSDTRR